MNAQGWADADPTLNAANRLTRRLIPARYNDPATSGLEYDISADRPNDFEVKLTK